MEKKKLSPLFLNAFGIGDFGFAMMTGVETMYWMFFLTNAVKLSLSVTSFVAGAAGLFDIAWMIVAGLIIQGTNFKGGKYRPWLLIAPPVVFVTTLFMYWPFSGNGTMAIVLILVGYIVSHLFYNISYTCHLSMVADYTDDAGERAILSSRKTMWMSAGNVLFSIAIIPLLDVFGGQSQPTAFFYWIAVVLCIMLFGYLALYVLAKPYEITIPGAGTAEQNADAAVQGPPPETMAEAIKVTVTNVPFIILLLAQIGTSTGMFFMMSGIPYYFQSIFAQTPTFMGMPLMSAYMFVTAIVGIIGAWLAPMISSKFGKKNLYCAGAIINACFIFLVYFMFSSNFPLFLACVAIGGFINSFGAGLGFAFFADCITYNIWRTGKSGAGFLMAVASLPIKIAVMLRGILMPMLYGVLGVVIDEFGMTGTDPASQAGLKFICLLLPQVLVVVFIVIIFIFFRLDDKRVAELNADIAAGRAPGLAK